LPWHVYARDIKSSSFTSGKSVTLPELFSDDLQKWIVYRVCQVGNCYRGRTNPISTRANSNDPHRPPNTLADERGFILIPIDSVEHHIISLVKDFIRCRLREKFTHYLHTTRGVNRLHTSAQKLGF
jgi:hypothetical protein